MHSFRPEYMVFIGAALSIQLAVNYYIYRLGSWVITSPLWRKLYAAAFIFLALSYIIGRFAERISYDNPFTIVLIWTGSVWFAFMTYLGFGAIALDLVRSAFFSLSKLGAHVPSPVVIKYCGAITVWVIAIIVVICGLVNAKIPMVREVQVPVTGLKKSISIAAVTDVHLGIMINKKEIASLVDRVNALHPDLIIIGGDLFDEDLESIVNNGIGEDLSRFKAPLGVYAVTGNHEYFGGVERAVAYMESHGISVLRDRAVKTGPFILVGRDDLRGAKMSGVERKSLVSILNGIDRSAPVIVVDHEPYNLSESSGQKIALQISGHTHHGQMWPFNLVTSKMYELSTGLLKKGDCWFYVSTGYGTWGPPVRTGNRPEIALITVVPQ